MSQASQEFGKSVCSCSRLPREPGASTSRSARRSLIEVNRPDRSSSTRIRPLSSVVPSTLTGTYGGVRGPSRAAPEPGTSTRTAARPSLKTCPAPAASSAGTVTTSVRATGLVLNTQADAPAPASAATAEAVIASSSARTWAYVASASRCTQAIELPGRMSWNWCSSTVFQSRSSSSYGYASPACTAAVSDHSSASRHPLPSFVRLTHPVEDLRVALLEPCVLLRLRPGEHQLRVLLGQRGDVGEGTGDLAFGLPNGPEPGAVDVRVAGGGNGVGASTGGRRQHVHQTGAGRRGGSGDIADVEGVQAPLQCAQDLVPSWVVRRQLEHQLT